MSLPVAAADPGVEGRREAAVRIVGSGAAGGRVWSAPAGYLLTQGPSDVARQCELLTPLPGPGEVRSVCTPAGGLGWRLDIAARDRPGLLAAFTGLLWENDVDVRQAVLATWGDGGALQALVVSRPVHVDFAASLGRRLESQPIADAIVTYPRAGPGPYTSCEVRAADRPGLLHSVAVAIASAGGDVHAARVTTANGQAHDRFDLSYNGGPLTAAAARRIEQLILSGATAPGPPRRARRRRV